MQRIRQRSTLAALILALAALGAGHGCTNLTATGTTGLGVDYTQGYSRGIIRADSEQVLAAARAVFREREMYIVEEEMDRPRPRLTARTAAERRVRVMVEPRVAGRTEVWVRYGTFGDANQSAMLFHRIAEVAEQGQGQASR